MSDDTSRRALTASRPSATVECPWCGAIVELLEAASTIECADCSVIVDLAPDEPTVIGVAA